MAFLAKVLAFFGLAYQDWKAEIPVNNVVPG